MEQINSEKIEEEQIKTEKSKFTFKGNKQNIKK